jgi:hypothetical protein
MAIDIGRIAYMAYVEQLKATHLNPWEKLGQTQQDAWRHAAVAVSQYLRKEHERIDTETPDDPVIA